MWQTSIRAFDNKNHPILDGNEPVERVYFNLPKNSSSTESRSKRVFLVLALGGLCLLGQPSFGEVASPPANSQKGLERKIQELFANLPERKSFKIWAPATQFAPGFLAELHGPEQLFSASANKVFILCERLRQLDSPTVEEQLVTHELKLDKQVWSLGSPVFNPPYLSGLVSERTAMEAMITHSDNTATDMILKEAGADRVRQFIGSIGLTSTMIPDSTRALAAYLFGAPNYETITWDQLQALLGKPFVHPVLNEVETLASSADDLVSFYERALPGQFFRNRQTLVQFRRILSLGDITYLVPFPLGANVFGKAGYFDYPGQHARCIAGGMYFPDRWVYFAAILNWDSVESDDPATVAAFFDALRKAITLVQNQLGN
jgi:beta-lactamase class A